MRCVIGTLSASTYRLGKTMDAVCVKICMTPEGITVSSEPLTEPPQGEPVESVEAALAKAGEMLSGGGGAPVEQQAEQDFTSGFA